MIGKMMDVRAGSGARPSRPGPALGMFPFMFGNWFTEFNPESGKSFWKISPVGGAGNF